MQELRELLEKEWGQFQNFETNVSEIRTPHPIIAIHKDSFVGGLVYSLWSKTEGGAKVYLDKWANCKAKIS